MKLRPLLLCSAFLLTGCWGGLSSDDEEIELTGEFGPRTREGKQPEESTGFSTLPLNVEVPIFMSRLVDTDVEATLKADRELLQRTFGAEALGNLTWKALHQAPGGDRWAGFEPVGSRVVNRFAIAKSFGKVWGRRLEGSRKADAYVVGYCLLDDSPNGWTILNAITWLPSWLLPLPLHSSDSGTFFVAIFDRDRRRVAAREFKVSGTYGGLYRATWLVQRGELVAREPALAAAKVAYDMIRANLARLRRE